MVLVNGLFHKLTGGRNSSTDSNERINPNEEFIAKGPCESTRALVVPVRLILSMTVGTTAAAVLVVVLLLENVEREADDSALSVVMVVTMLAVVVALALAG